MDMQQGIILHRTEITFPGKMLSDLFVDQLFLSHAVFNRVIPAKYLYEENLSPLNNRNRPDHRLREEGGKETVLPRGCMPY